MDDCTRGNVYIQPRFLSFTFHLNIVFIYAPSIELAVLNLLHGRSLQGNAYIYVAALLSYPTPSKYTAGYLNANVTALRTA